jgi:hypothetical protein
MARIAENNWVETAMAPDGVGDVSRTVADDYVVVNQPGLKL